MSPQNFQTSEVYSRGELLELTPRHKTTELHIAVYLVLIALVCFLGLYVAYEKYQEVSEIVSSFSVQNSLTYINSQYGFEVVLPVDWQGYKIATSSKDIYAINGSSGQNIVGHFPLIEIVSPLSTKAVPMQNIPVDVFTQDQWKHIGDEQTADWSVSAAPIGPSILGQNSQYVFALPARYNFAYLPGWQEVQAIIDSHPLKAFEPAEPVPPYGIPTKATNTDLK